MRIALIAEGCYPYVTGGVSTWCDQLVRGLAEETFEVIAVTATGRMRPVLELPGNVETVTTVPLWEFTPAPLRPPRAVRQQFLALYRTLLAAALDPAAVQRGFDLTLVEVFDFAQQHGLTAVFREDSVVDALIDAWHTLYPAVPIHVRDAMQATELVEHILLPLAAPVPVADVTHPVSNGLPALIALTAKWRYGTPMVMSEHGVYLRERYLGMRTVAYPWPVKTVLLAFMRRLCHTAYEAADVITPVNVFNRRWEVRHGADPDRIRTVYNGVDAAALPAATADPDVPTVGWVGRIDPLKDLHTLARAFAVVHAHLPQARLRLFGPTPGVNAGYEASVRELVTELTLDGVVTFEGPIRPATKGYHASTVVALSSISEGLPYTVMEAMMCRRATVSTDVGGVAEVTGDAGMVVPARDPQALGKALLALLTDPKRREAMAERARARSLEMFQLDTMLDNFREIYVNVVAEAALEHSALWPAALPGSVDPARDLGVLRLIETAEPAVREPHAYEGRRRPRHALVRRLGDGQGLDAPAGDDPTVLLGRAGR